MLQFGLSAVVSKKAVKTSNGEKVVKERQPLPAVITLTTVAGRFNITDAAMKVLGLQKADSILFVTNYDSILTAIATKDESITAIAIERDMDIDSDEFKNAMLKEFGKVYVTKGFPKFASDGTPIMGNERLTKKEKVDLLAIQLEDLIVSKRPEIAPRVVEAGKAMSVSEVTEEQIREFITPDDVVVPQVQQHQGAKISVVGSAVQLFNFSDATVYNQLSVGVPADHIAIYTIKPETTEYPISDGIKEIACTMFELELDGYKEKIQKKAKSAASTEEVVEEVANEEFASAADELPFEGSVEESNEAPEFDPFA